MRLLVQNVEKMVNARMPDDSLQMLFAAYRLPSPLGSTDHFSHLSPRELTDVKEKTRKNIEVLCQKAGLNKDMCLKELLRILPCAEAHRSRQGCGIREAWARASVDFKELKHARSAVTLYLSFEAAEGDVERKLKNVSWQESDARAHMLGCSLESLVLAMQAPMPEAFCEKKKRPDGGVEIIATSDYMPSILKAYVERFGAKKRKSKTALVEPKTRRDSGVKRQAEPQPEDVETEASFLRKRKACVDKICSASAEERAQWLEEAKVPVESPNKLERISTDKNEKVQKVINRVVQKKRSADKQQPAPKRRAREKQGSWASKQGEYVRPGLCLTNSASTDVSRQARHVGYQIVSPQGGGADAVAFLEGAFRRAGAGHLVLVESLRSAATDLTCGGVACRLVGGFLASASSFLARKPLGMQFRQDLHRPRLVFVDSDQREKIHRVLEAAAKVPGSKLEVASSLSAIMKKYTAHRNKFGNRSKPWLKMRALWPVPKNSEKAVALHKKCPFLFSESQEFLTFLEGGIDRSAVCPGFFMTFSA